MLIRLASLVKKEFLQFSRDWVILIILLYSFTVDIYLVTRGFNLEVRRTPVAICDLDGSPASRGLIERFRLPYFSPEAYVHEEAKVKDLLHRGKVTMALVIPPHFAQTLKEGRQAKVQLIVDGTHSNSALIAMGYAARIIEAYSQQTVLENWGLTLKGLQLLPRVDLLYRIRFNPNLKSEYFMGLTELFSVITMIAILLPAAALVREKEHGTIEQLLVTPLRPHEIMLAKIIPMGIITFLATFLAIFTVLQPLFGIPLRGNLGLFFLATFVFVFTSSGLGLFLASISKSLSEVILLILLLITPILFLSGSWTPYEAMPFWMKRVTYLSPLKYFLEIGFSVFLKGLGFQALWKEFLGLLLLGSLAFLLGVVKFRSSFE
ncbi:MAG: ABC transporter permease [candidate division NC10 bacterium]|nr:ABC transporter permease [candidate division NC10 bacterium]